MYVYIYTYLYIYIYSYIYISTPQNRNVANPETIVEDIIELPCWKFLSVWRLLLYKSLKNLLVDDDT